MNQAYSVIIRACSWLAGRNPSCIGLAAISMAVAPGPAWGQWTGGPTGPIYYNGGNVGIGTTAPGWKLDIGGPGASSAYSRLGGVSILTADSGYEWWTGSFTDFQSWQLTRRRISDGAWTNALTVLTSGNVGIGTSNPQSKLAVNGNITAQDVMVTNTGWSDYVFQPDYPLRPLSEVSAYIREYHHLPDIPSEAEVKAKGVSVGEMQAKLLAKVEELTLHMIQAEDRNNRLEQDNRELRERITRLEKNARAEATPVTAK